MGGLFGGALIFACGLALAVVAFYYAWASGTPGFGPEAYQQYQLYSTIFGVLAIGVIVLGGYWVVASIRKMNREYKESRQTQDSKERN